LCLERYIYIMFARSANFSKIASGLLVAIAFPLEPSSFFSLKVL
jgi:hypothetical protein